MGYIEAAVGAKTAATPACSHAATSSSMGRGITVEVRYLVELQRIDKDRDHNVVGPLRSVCDKSEVPGVQRTHGWNKTDATPRSPAVVGPRLHFGGGLRRSALSGTVDGRTQIAVRRVRPYRFRSEHGVRARRSKGVRSCCKNQIQRLVANLRR